MAPEGIPSGFAAQPSAVPLRAIAWWKEVLEELRHCNYEKIRSSSRTGVHAHDMDLARNAPELRRGTSPLTVKFLQALEYVLSSLHADYRSKVQHCIPDALKTPVVSLNLKSM